MSNEHPMNLYLLQRTDRIFHDESRAHVVAAPTVEDARELVARMFPMDTTALHPFEPWQSDETSTCELLGVEGKPAPSSPRKKTAPTSTPKLPPKVKQAPSEAPPSKPVEAPPVPALASVPAAPPPGTTPPGSPPPTVTHGFRTSFIGAFPGLSASPTPAPAPAPAATTFTGDRLGFRR